MAQHHEELRLMALAQAASKQLEAGRSQGAALSGEPQNAWSASRGGPLIKGEKIRSDYLGVGWHKGNASWRVQVTYPQTKRSQHVGYYASEEDAARAYDRAAVQVHGPYAERNFPHEAIIEEPETVGDKRKQRSTSRYLGVHWDSSKSTWRVTLRIPQTNRKQYFGSFASEEDAARAFDRAVVQVRGPGAKRNFPDEALGVSDPQVEQSSAAAERSESAPGAGATPQRAAGSVPPVQQSSAAAQQSDQDALGSSASSQRAAAASTKGEKRRRSSTDQAGRDEPAPGSVAAAGQLPGTVGAPQPELPPAALRPAALQPCDFEFF
ncbi:hypothetical protein FOA52_002624 [Chlamydomonas sp. UWO 241]|nr:hypothetical protein FOA52_002624 [Chlamydomonas sp. UWO 241]